MFEMDLSRSRAVSTASGLDSGRSLWQTVTGTWNIRATLTQPDILLKSKRQKPHKKHKKKKREQGHRYGRDTVEGLDSGRPRCHFDTQDVEHSNNIHASRQPPRSPKTAFSGGMGGFGKWSFRAASAARAWNTRTSLG